MSSRLIPLHTIDLLQISGPDTDRFLQGQLTCNMEQLTAEHALPGAYCNIKGRVIADFIALRHDDHVILVLQSGMAEVLKQTLQKYAVFFKTDMSIVTHEWQSVGLLGDSGDPAGNSLRFLRASGQYSCTRWQGAMSITLPGSPPRLMLLIPSTAGEVMEEIEACCDPGDPLEWELAEIAAGAAHVDPEISEQYTPQLLNYDLNGTVDFRKGCYTGQEVVARMHYRGTAKKRMYRALTPASTWSASTRRDALRVVDSSGRHCGEVITAARHPDSSMQLLVILPCALVDSATESSPAVFLTERSDPAVPHTPVPLTIHTIQ